MKPEYSTGTGNRVWVGSPENFTYNYAIMSAIRRSSSIRAWDPVWQTLSNDSRCGESNRRSNDYGKELQCDGKGCLKGRCVVWLKARKGCFTVAQSSVTLNLQTTKVGEEYNRNLNIIRYTRHVRGEKLLSITNFNTMTQHDVHADGECVIGPVSYVAFA